MIIHPDNWAAPTTPFTLVVNFNNGGLGLPSGSMMKIVFTNSENASGIPRTYETVTLPIIL